MRKLLGVALLAALLPSVAGAATIVGGARGERVVGTRLADLVDVTGGGRDRVACRGGLDTVMADPTDAVAADCETVARRVARDTTNGPGEHETIAEPGAASNGSTVVGAFQVARNRDGGAARIGFTTSTDAGTTWRSGLLPTGGWPVASDPVVAWDAVHRRWLVGALGLSGTEEALTITPSADGLAWGAPVSAVRASRAEEAVPLDKEWLACDNGAASPFAGRCYLAATVHTDTPRAELALWSSTDAGATWTAGAVQKLGYFVQTAIRPNGTLVLVWMVGDTRTVVASRSSDGGATFSAPVEIARLNAGPRVRGLRAPSLPSVATSSAGELVAVWSDCVQSGCEARSILLTRSPDGVTWSEPTPLPLGPGDHVLPSVAVEPGSGRLALADYTSPPLACCDLVAQVASSVDGTSWQVRRASVRPMKPSWLALTEGGAFLGDYVATVFARGRALSLVPLAVPPLKSGARRQALFAVRY